MKTFAALTTCLLLSACAVVATGTRPEAVDGDGVETTAGGSFAKIYLADYSVTIEIDGYNNDVALIGPIVPIIPIVTRDEPSLKVKLSFTPKTTTGSFRLGSLKVVHNGQEHYPTLVKAGKTFGTKSLSKIDNREPVAINGEMVLLLDFGTLAPPSDQFAIIADGLPRVSYQLKRRNFGGFGVPKS